MRRRLSMISAAVLAALLAPPARAQVCERSLALRVNTRGLAFVAEQVKARVPTELALPAVKKTVVDWPLTDKDAEVQIDGLTVKLALDELTLKPDGEALGVHVKARVTSGGPVIVNNPYLGAGRANCQLDLDLQALEIDLGLQLSSPGGQLQLTVTKALVKLDNERSKTALTGCALGDGLTAILGFVRQHLMGTVQSKIEALAKEKIPELVKSKLGETLQRSGELKGIGYTVQLGGLATDEGGLEALVGAGVTLAPVEPAPACAASGPKGPAVCLSSRPALGARSEAMFGVAVAEGMLNHVIEAAWRAGKLCLDSRTITNPLVAAGLFSLGPKLGQPEGTKVSFVLRLSEAPRLHIGAQSGITLGLTGVDLRVTLAPPGGPEGGLALSADLAVGVSPAVDPQTGSVSLELTNVTVGRLALAGKDGSASGLAFDAARLEQFLTQVALPTLQQKVANLKLTPAVLQVQGFLLELKHFSTVDGSLALYVDLYQPKPSGERVPPETTLLDRPAGILSPRVLSLTAAGQDNETPANLLRYAFRVDGNKWSEPSFGRRLDVTIHGGKHLIEVSAVDLAGNVDPTPASFAVEVDHLPPTVDLMARPDALVSSRKIAVAFSAADDRTPAMELAATAELLRLPEGGGMPAVVKVSPLEKGATVASFDGLEGGVYKVRLTVRDAAGNVTSMDVGFTVEPQTGCSVGTPAGAGSTLAFILLGLVLLGRRRWRS
ncbi:MAG: hypothetical protein IT371_04720 [Deltaproteobacteria bacterium]|nr:hypothetical protein [Deltaproteobacteria bacterium]